MGNAAIYLHPDGYSTSGERLMGRQSAGESFLRGFLRHADVDRFNFWMAGGLPVPAYQQLVTAHGPLRRDARWIASRSRGGLKDPGCVFIPSPTIGPEAWWRRRYGPASYSLCGLTHTTASHRAVQALDELLTSPTEPWDGLICTSAAVRSAVENQLALIVDDLRGRLGATRLPQPQLATIPLGVNADDFAHDPAARRAWRESLNIPEEAVVVLYVGRLHVAAKMNPALMAQALEQAAVRTGKTICWIVSGWAHSPAAEESFHAATRALCPSVLYRPVDGRPTDTRFSIWSAADLFISFSDNVQETFGLTPAEAMAAGLPCVVTDWNGYRDTVRHGLDGFRIPTYAPRRGLGEDLSFDHDNGWISYEAYVGAAAQMTAMDMAAAVDALASLIENPALRRQMGESGRRHVASALDWSQVIPQYQAFWGELGKRRAAAQPEAPDQARRLVNPRRMDPFTIFSAYPTAVLQPQDRLVAQPKTWADAETLLSAPLANLGRWAMARPEECEAMFNHVAASDGATVEGALQQGEPARRPFLERTLLWMIKFDVLRLTAPVAVAADTPSDAQVSRRVADVMGETAKAGP